MKARKKTAVKGIFFFLMILFFSSAPAQQDSAFHFSLDLTKTHNDMLTVELVTPAMKTDTVIYRLPAIVPGTYKVYDFGRFTHGFKALDKNGKELFAEGIDLNSWKIGNAKQLYKITYDVEDTWDTDVKGEFVFEPAGTNIEPDSNFVINNHGFFGYFDGMKRDVYKISITHPDGFYGATGLSDVQRSGNTDVFTTQNYMDLVDGPIMYNRPDTTHIFVGGADVLISVYSP
ncbi:MAG TPA: peptidase M61, partial [Bacteroidia bacterium]|nr:peptidase M61 [Bacteroidia bacterium]